MSGLVGPLAGPALFPFTLAAAVMAGLVAVEVLSLLFGHSLSALVDGALGHGGDGHEALGAADGGADAAATFSPAALMSWINLGRVPFLILLILGLAAFALAGFVVQWLAGALAAPLPAPLAVLLAGAATLPALRVSTRAVARLIPRDESYVVTADELVGVVGEVTLGPIDGGLPGQVRALDRHGNAHSLRARAAPGAPAMASGTRVLLVDRVEAVYVAVPASGDL